MKMKHGLIIVTMIIISLLAVGVASASDNASDVVGTADFEEVVTVDNNPVSAVAVEDSSEVENDMGNPQILSVGNEDEPVAANETENTNDTQSDKRIDWMSLYSKDEIGNNSIVLNLSGLFGNNNKNSSFLILDLDNLWGEDTYDGSYLILGLSDIFGGNNTDDSSYLVFDISGVLGGNKTDHSYLVLGSSTMGLDTLGKTALVLDLSELLTKDPTLESSYLSLDLTPIGIEGSIDLGLPFLLEKGSSLLGIDLNDYFNENVTDLPSFLDNLNWTGLSGGNVSNLTSLLDSLNWSELFNGNYSSLVDALGLNDYFNEDVTDLPSFLDNLNWTDVLGANTTNLTSLLDSLNWSELFDGNYSSLVDALGWNDYFNEDVTDLPSFLDNMNWTEIFGENAYVLASLFDELNWTDLFNGNYSSLVDALGLNDYFNETGFDLPSFLDDFNWTRIFGENTGWASLFDNLNWTALFNGDYIPAIDDLNLTDKLEFNVSDILSLFDFNLTSLFDDLNWTALLNGDYTKAFDCLNWTDILGLDTSDILSLFDYNLSSILDKINWDSLFGGNDNGSNSLIDWSSIIGGKFSFSDSVIRVTTINDSQITATLMDPKNNAIPYSVVSYTINGGEKNYLLTNRKGEFVIEGQNNCVINMVFSGNIIFASTNATVNLKKIKPAQMNTKIVVPTTMTKTAVDFKAGENGSMFYFNLQDGNGKPIANKAVKIGIFDKTYTVKTDKNGRGGLQINIANANYYTYAITFLGDDEYKASFAVCSLQIVKKSVTITPAKTSYSFQAGAKTKTVTATLKSTNSYIPKGKQVTLTVAGKTFKATVGDKGQISFNIGSITKKGTYNVAVKFAGTNTYSAATSKTITIKLT